MAISDSQKVDLLFKKVGYGVAKTDTSTYKGPANEGNASPMVSPGSTIYQQDYAISSVTTLPTSNSSVVTVYRDSLTSTVQCTKLPTTSANVSWSTGLTDWVPIQYGTGYQVKLYAGPAGSSTPQNYKELPAGGSGNNDDWNFDYQAGIVNFADTSVPTAASTGGNVVYVVGARYTGVKGIATFSNISIGNITINGNTITGNTGVTIGGTLTAPYFIGDGSLLTGLPASYSNANVASYLPTYSGNISAGNVISKFYGNISADTITPYSTQVTIFNNATAIGLPVGTSTQYPTANSAGYIRYNSSISTIEFYNGSSWQPLTNSITDQQITPDGINQTFTLDQSTTAVGIIVSINGTLQSPGSGAYSVSTNQITFAEIPQVTDIIDVRFIASALTNVNIDATIIDSANITVGTSNVIVDSFTSSAYRGVKYTISSTNSSDSQISDVLLTQFNGTVSVSTTGNVRTGSNSITFYANVNGSTVNLLAKGTTGSNQLRIERTYFNV